MGERGDICAEFSHLWRLGDGEGGVLGEETHSDRCGGLFEGMIVAGLPVWEEFVECARLDYGAGKNMRALDRG